MAKRTSPVAVSTTHANAVTNSMASLRSHNWRFARVNAVPRSSVSNRNWRSRLCARIMNSAAGTPLPDTSPMTKATPRSPTSNTS